MNKEQFDMVERKVHSAMYDLMHPELFSPGQYIYDKRNKVSGIVTQVYENGYRCVISVYSMSETSIHRKFFFTIDKDDAEGSIYGISKYGILIDGTTWIVRETTTSGMDNSWEAVAQNPEVLQSGFGIIKSAKKQSKVTIVPPDTVKEQRTFIGADLHRFAGCIITCLNNTIFYASVISDGGRLCLYDKDGYYFGFIDAVECKGSHYVATVRCNGGRDSRIIKWRTYVCITNV